MDKNIEKVPKRFPATFEVLKEYNVDDMRFMSVKFWLMHTGVNLNSSIFTKEVVENNLDTLANTPILGFIEKNEDGEIDFSDHRTVIVEENGEFKFKYLCNAYGVIAETNNAQFEMKVDSDGIEREYVTCEGIMWRKWDEPIQIMERDKIKDVSIEISDNYTGEFNKDGNFIFSSFEYFGVTILSNDDSVQPAMKGASIETYSYNDILKDIENKLNKFNNITRDSKGGELIKNKIEFELSDDIIDKLSDRIIEKFKGGFSVGKDFKLTESQLREELRNKFREEKITDDWGWEYSRYWLVDYKDVEAYVEDMSENGKIYKFTFEIKGDAVEVNWDSKKRVKIEFVDFEGEDEPDQEYAFIPQEFIDGKINAVKDKAEQDAKDKFTTEKQTEIDNAVQEAVDVAVDEKTKELKDQFSAKEKELNELKNSFEALKQEKETLINEKTELEQFKQEKLDEERKVAEDELFSAFAEKLTEEEIQPIKDKASEMSLDDIEKELYVVFGRKNVKFSYSKKKPDIVKLPVDNSGDKVKEKYYGEIEEKYGVGE